MLLRKKKPVILRRDRHPISRRNIDEDALKVLYRLKQCGHTAYLVGGGVRDLLIGRQPKDFDIGTSAHPNQVRKLFRNCFLIGRRFRLAHIRFGEKIIETSTFRRRPDPLPEGATTQQQAQDNTFGTPAEDAQRRDFTINGLFYDINTFAVIDHVGGLDDLKRKLVRTIGDPDERFIEDPVRMIRAVRFAARLGFKIERKTMAAILRNRKALSGAAPSRMLEEICRLAPFGSSAAAMNILHQTRLLEVVFPELAATINESSETADILKGMLQQLDQRDLPAADLTPAVVFGYVYCPVFRKEIELLPENPHITEYLKIARSILEPSAARYHLPKKYFYDIIHQYALQGRLELNGFPPTVRKRMLIQPFFRPGLSLYRDYLKASGQPVALLDELGKMAEKVDPLEIPAPRRRKRRPRRRRRTETNAA